MSLPSPETIVSKPLPPSYLSPYCEVGAVAKKMSSPPPPFMVSVPPPPSMKSALLPPVMMSSPPSPKIAQDSLIFAAGTERTGVCTPFWWFEVPKRMLSGSKVPPKSTATAKFSQFWTVMSTPPAFRLPFRPDPGVRAAICVMRVTLPACAAVSEMVSLSPE